MANPQYLLQLRIDVGDDDPEVYGFCSVSGDADIYLDGIWYTQGLLKFSPSSREFDFRSGGSTSGGATFTVVRDAFDPIDARRHNIQMQTVESCVYWWDGSTSTLRYKDVIDSGILGSVKVNQDSWSASIRAKAYVGHKLFPRGVLGDEGRFDLYQAAVSEAPVSSSSVCQWVFGLCYDVPIYQISHSGGSPSGLGRYYVAAHQVHSGYVVVLNEGAVIGVRSTTLDVDGLGNYYTYVEAVAPPDADLYIAELYGYSDSNTMVDGLGDVLTTIVNQNLPSNVLDLDRVATATKDLNRFKVSSVFNSPDTDVFGLLDSRYSAQFPVAFSVYRGLFGWDYLDLTSREVVTGLIYGQSCFNRGALTETDSADIQNNFMAAFAQSGYSGGGGKGYVLNKNNSPTCAASVSRWGDFEGVEVDLPDVGSFGSAYLALNHMSYKNPGVRTFISYDVIYAEAMTYPFMTCVSVVDEEYGFDEELFYVISVEPMSTGLISLGLVSVDWS